jgi:hypothetical protein
VTDYFPQHANKPAPKKVAKPATVKNVKVPAPGPAVYANQQQQPEKR